MPDLPSGTERVRRTSIRCEGCGARFEDLEAYRLHRCEMHYL